MIFSLLVAAHSTVAAALHDATPLPPIGASTTLGGIGQNLAREARCRDPQGSEGEWLTAVDTAAPSLDFLDSRLTIEEATAKHMARGVIPATARLTLPLTQLKLRGDCQLTSLWAHTLQVPAGSQDGVRPGASCLLLGHSSPASTRRPFLPTRRQTCTLVVRGGGADTSAASYELIGVSLEVPSVQQYAGSPRDAAAILTFVVDKAPSPRRAGSFHSSTGGNHSCTTPSSQSSSQSPSMPSASLPEVITVVASYSLLSKSDDCGGAMSALLSIAEGRERPRCSSVLPTRKDASSHLDLIGLADLWSTRDHSYFVYDVSETAGNSHRGGGTCPSASQTSSSGPSSPFTRVIVLRDALPIRQTSIDQITALAPKARGGNSVASLPRGRPTASQRVLDGLVLRYTDPAAVGVDMLQSHVRVRDDTKRSDRKRQQSPKSPAAAVEDGSVTDAPRSKPPRVYFTVTVVILFAVLVGVLYYFRPHHHQDHESVVTREGGGARDRSARRLRSSPGKESETGGDRSSRSRLVVADYGSTAA